MLTEMLMTAKAHPWQTGLVCLALVACLVAGCNMGPRRAAYTALAGTEITLDAAMQAWGDYQAQFHPPMTQEGMVQYAYDKVQAAGIAATDAAKVLSDLPTSNPAAIADAQAKADKASADQAQALSELVALLRSFGVKI